MGEKLKVGRYARIMMKNPCLAEAMQRGHFSVAEVREAAALVAQVRRDILAPGGPRRVVSQAEVFGCAAARLRPTEPDTESERVQILLEDLAAKTDPWRIFFRKGQKARVEEVSEEIFESFREGGGIKAARREGI